MNHSTRFSKLIQSDCFWLGSFRNIERIFISWRYNSCVNMNEGHEAKQSRTLLWLISVTGLNFLLSSLSRTCEIYICFYCFVLSIIFHQGSFPRKGFCFPGANARLESFFGSPYSYGKKLVTSSKRFWDPSKPISIRYDLLVSMPTILNKVLKIFYSLYAIYYIDDLSSYIELWTISYR